MEKENHLGELLERAMNIGSLDAGTFNNIIDGFSREGQWNLLDSIQDDIEMYLGSGSWAEMTKNGPYDFVASLYDKIQQMAVEAIESNYRWPDVQNYFDSEGFYVDGNYLGTSYVYSNSDFGKSLREKLAKAGYDGENEYVEFLLYNIN